MRFLALCAALAIGGCASTNYVSENYGSVDPVTFSPTGNPDDSYLIGDKPGENRMLILDRTGSGAASAFVSGATLGAVDTSAPDGRYRSVADAWLSSTARPCTAASVDRITRSAREVRYTCAAPTTQ